MQALLITLLPMKPWEREKKDVRAVVMSTNVLRESCFEIAMATFKRERERERFCHEMYL